MKFDEKSMVALDVQLKQWQAMAEQVRIQAAPALRQWHEVANLVAAQVIPTFKVEEVIRVSMVPMIEAQKAFPILVETKPWAQAFESIAIPRFELPDMSYLTRQATQLQKYL